LDEKHVSGWKNITDAVHQAGGKIHAQGNHVLKSLMEADKALLCSCGIVSKAY
jgi:2,4-dienoyl-CoA reductase-like NADH-dependent reductase (Old Yellow Enzyme family)